MTGEEKMSNTQELKDYLIGEDGFLLNDMHNGKTIMLSGAWGSGKTHFWQNEIEPKLFEELKKDDKSCTYISLYGKDSLNALKQEVFIKASSENSLLSKEVSTFGFEALSSIEDSDLAIGKVLSAAKGLNNYRKSTKGIKRLKDGGIICFDDFERKSKEIDLNDLFGFISQLAIEYQCKVVIILNSDVFEGEEANVFKMVKEKTVNKFFYFQPCIVELFYLIADDKKYNKLNDYKEDILKTIEETEELNARIYIQVLDNCLEWINKDYDSKVLDVLTLATIFFIKNHDVLDFNIVQRNKKQHKIITYYLDEGYSDIAAFLQDEAPQIFSSPESCFCKEPIQIMNNSLNKSKKEDKEVKSDDYYRRQNSVFEENKNFFRDFIFYVYVLKIDERTSQKEFKKINNFVKSGILPKINEVEV
jgi:hypothetical protein